MRRGLKACGGWAPTRPKAHLGELGKDGLGLVGVEIHVDLIDSLDREEMQVQLVDYKLRAAQLELERDESLMACRQLQLTNQQLTCRQKH